MDHAAALLPIHGRSRYSRPDLLRVQDVNPAQDPSILVGLTPTRYEQVTSIISMLKSQPSTAFTNAT
ncbi:hypothetical protein Dimus_036132, partial [Dionaea muscipula]